MTGSPSPPRSGPTSTSTIGLPPRFEHRLEALAGNSDPERFQQGLLELFQLHYLSAVLNLPRDRDIRQQHFSEMQYGFFALAAAGASPMEIVDNALHAIFYHDINYSWNNAAPLGRLNSYYSSRPLLYAMKRMLERAEHAH